ncbi:hypothetical protein T02_11579 [Trichinella nativa]|uniref:Uncharacterized protein n=1 Tax=Trichinella nativa TaxID=6335 RepID=A0A0V1KZ79_9BILA|nr:hypothetical protein T02_11579 [Trichinella nativa]
MSCDSTAPKPSPLASVSTRNGILKSGSVNTGCLVNRAFRCKNALSHSSVQFHSFPFSVSRWSGSAIWANPFTNRRVRLHTIAGYHMAQWHLEGFIFSPAPCSRENTSSSFSRCSAASLLKTIMSSKYTIQVVQCSPQRTVSIRRWNVAGALQSPKGITRN